MPQLFQPETIRLAHNDTGHQGVHKVASRILQRYEWPGIYDSVNKWIGSCITCLQARNPPGRTKFPLKNIESYRFNELVQIDHTHFSNISAEGYNQALVMIDHYTKFAEAVPCGDCNAEQVCELLIRKWFSRYGPPTYIQSDNAPNFAAEMTERFMDASYATYVHSTPLLWNTRTGRAREPDVEKPLESVRFTIRL